MANKKVSELATITAVQLATDDLFLVSDVSAHESKKLTTSELNTYLLAGGLISGSLHGTASWAQNAVSATFAPTPVTTSYSLVAGTANSVTNSINSTNAVSASWASHSFSSETASFALNASVTTATSASIANIAKTASFLVYSPLIFNGTASFAATASNVISSSHADTASFLLGSIASSSFATHATTADSSTTSNTASFLLYSGIPNGTASFALSSGVGVTIIKDYGIFDAITQSATVGQLDNVTISPSSVLPVTTSFEVWGSVTVPFTSSTLLSESLKLVALDRNSGIPVPLDVTPIYVDLAAVPNAWDSFASGTLKMPYSLVGHGALSGSYEVYVTASSTNISLGSSRIIKFNVSSRSDNVTVAADISPALFVHPLATLLYWSGSAGSGSATAAALVAAGSGSGIAKLTASNAGVDQLKYVWTETALVDLDFSSNASLKDVGGMPNTIVTMSVQNCGLLGMTSLANSSIQILNCSSNNLVALPSLPASMSLISSSINCSGNNSLSSLPSTLPYGLTVFLCDNTIVGSPPATLPNSLISMSFNNAGLTLWATTLPSSLVYFSCNANPSLTSLPTVPANVLYLDCANCDITPASLDNICGNLVTNALTTGSLNIANNQPLLPATLVKIATLQGRDWTVVS